MHTAWPRMVLKEDIGDSGPVARLLDAWNYWAGEDVRAVHTKRFAAFVLDAICFLC